MKKFDLNTQWKLFLHKRREIPEHFNFPEAGIPAQIPGTVHTDLLNAGLIPDPFYDMNEKELQWIARNDWRYETVFDLPAQLSLDEPLWLVFEGIDTAAVISLNDQTVAQTRNMFRSFRFEISALLKRKGNRLTVVLSSPLQLVQENKYALQQMPSTRHPDRVFLRKAQYAFGWDWGPAYPTSGIWRPVYLLQQKGGIRHVYFDVLALNDERAELLVSCDFWGDPGQNVQAEFEFFHGGKIIRGQLEAQGARAKAQFEVQNPERWWPNGLGEPILHRLIVRVRDAQGRTLDEQIKRVGIRTVELVTSENGKSAFYFKVNGRKVFIKGADWIPADSFLPRVKKETYRSLLHFARNAHLNALRVWGGGIYEADDFYELCDQLGLMVWQDFMFACAAYPQKESFVREVKSEIEENVGRLRFHPSVILWCGNNENEWIWHREMDTPVSEMPGFELFHHLFPKWLKDLDPYRPYWPTTPWGGEDDPNGMDSGNRHAWEIWSMWQDYSTVKEDLSLFVTEFGFQAPAHYQTLKASIPAEKFFVQSESFEWHNKQVEGPERLFRFLSAHLPVRTEPEAFVYLTQLNQAFALQTCLEHWRTNGRTNGAIIWQINDCWPVSSWSLIDSNLRPKLGYYQVRRSFAPVLLTFHKKADGLEIKVKTDALTRFEGHLEAMRISGVDGRVEAVFAEDVWLMAGQTASILAARQTPETAVWVATVYDAQGEMVARNVYHAKPWKYLRLPATEGKISVVPKEERFLEVRSKAPAFFVELRHPLFNFSDQGFVLLPDERKLVEILNPGQNVHLDGLEIWTLNQFLTKK